MTYLIAYDITDNTRRGRVADLLLDFGDRIQYSIYLARLTQQELDKLAHALVLLIHPIQDKLHIYRICRSCERGIQILGKPTIPTQWVI